MKGQRALQISPALQAEGPVKSMGSARRHQEANVNSPVAAQQINSTCQRSQQSHQAWFVFLTLHYIALHYITLHSFPFHSITLIYTTLHYTRLNYIALPCIALHYNTLDHVALQYITLYHTTLHYTTLHYTTLHYSTEDVFDSQAALCLKLLAAGRLNPKHLACLPWQGVDDAARAHGRMPSDIRLWSLDFLYSMVRDSGPVPEYMVSSALGY